MVVNVDADAATGAAATSRQRGKKDNGRQWSKSSPRINSYTIHEYEVWGRGLRSVETTYKDIKIKAAMKLDCNLDPSMEAVRMFEEKSVRGGQHSVIKDASRYAEELGLHLKLEPMCVTTNVRHRRW